MLPHDAPVSFWTARLDKGHCDQYNRRYLAAVSSIALKECLSRRKAVMPTTSPLRIHADMPAVVFDVPAGTDVLTVPCPALPLANPTRAIAQALLTPRGTLPLAQVVAAASP